MEVTEELDGTAASFGAAVDEQAERLGVMPFREFVRLRNTQPGRPELLATARPERGAPEAKAAIFEAVNRLSAAENLARNRTHAEKLKNHRILNLYTDNLAGYGAFVSDHFQRNLAGFSRRRPFVVGGGSRRGHTYVTGGSGSGKTEVVKAMIWHALEVKDPAAMVLIEPHGEASEQVARFRQNAKNGRLIYIFPRLSETVFPGLNPFDLPGKDRFSDDEAETVADEFLHAFREILRDDMSLNMEVVLKNLLPVLVKMPGATVYDLIAFLQPRDKEAAEYPAEKYLSFARSHIKNPQILDFLETQFENDSSFLRTRAAVASRLRLVFGSSLMQRLYSGPRTVDLEAGIRAGKLMIFNLSGMGSSAAVVGRILLVQLKIIALSFGKIPKDKRPHCHAYVDECQRFVTQSVKDIFAEARKFGLYLTLAQQDIGGDMDAEIYSCLKANVMTRVSGPNSAENRRITHAETLAPLEDLDRLTRGKFSLWQRDTGRPPVTVTFPPDAVDDRGAMSAAEWERVRAEQLASYYRKPTPHAPGRPRKAQEGAGMGSPTPSQPEAQGGPNPAGLPAFDALARYLN